MTFIRRFAAVSAVALPILATFAYAPLGAQSNLGRTDMAWRWDGAVPSGSWLRLYNVNGAVAVTASRDANVHVRATKRARSGGDPTTVHFDVVRGNGVTICALWSDRATCDEQGAHNNTIHTGMWDRRQNVEVVFDVQVPTGVRAAMNTVNGELQIAGVSSDVVARTVNGELRVQEVGAAVTARTVNGDVTVTTRGGPVSAETVNGSIAATMASQGTSDMHFRTVNGTIEIVTPASLNAVVDLKTVNGSIDSRYPLTFDRRHRHADGTVGRGGPELVALTVNGSISLQ